ncbi:MAG TPA: hypothetical protein VHE99_00510 [Gammaproteobacteria bacterium]|nr:hypothetical protein [Gammaproteobacteria bacterium]
MSEFKQAASAVINLSTSVGLSAEAGDKMSEYGKFGQLMALLAFTNQDQLSKAYDVKAKSDSKASMGTLTQRQVFTTLDELNLSAEDMLSVLNHMTTLSQLLQERPELLKEFFEICKIQQSFKNGDASFIGDRINSLAAFALKAFGSAIGTTLAGTLSSGVAVGIAALLIAAEKGVDYAAEKKFKSIETGLQKIDQVINQSVIATLGAMSNHKKFQPFKDYIDAAIQDIKSGSDPRKALDALNNVKMLREYQLSDSPTLDRREHMQISIRVIDKALKKATDEHAEVTQKLSSRTLLEEADPATLAKRQKSLEGTITALKEQKKAIEKIMPVSVDLDISTIRSRSLSQDPAQREQAFRTPIKFHADPALESTSSRSRSQSAAPLKLDMYSIRKPTVIHFDNTPLSSSEADTRSRSHSSSAPKNPPFIPSSPGSAPASPGTHFSYSAPKRSTSTPMGLSALRERSTSTPTSPLTSSNGFFYKPSRPALQSPKHTTSPASSSQSRSRGMTLGTITE